uniref:Uncharacterized protein n=1 Tax=Rhizophora mucronata TaxID=61149 RepID=A0A2P2QTD0_RHIMU
MSYLKEFLKLFYFKVVFITSTNKP